MGFPYDLCRTLRHPHTGFSVSPSREDLITTISVPQFGFEQHHFSPMRMSTSPGSDKTIVSEQTCGLVVIRKTAWHSKQVVINQVQRTIVEITANYGHCNQPGGRRRAPKQSSRRWGGMTSPAASNTGQAREQTPETPYPAAAARSSLAQS